MVVGCSFGCLLFCAELNVRSGLMEGFVGGLCELYILMPMHFVNKVLSSDTISSTQNFCWVYSDVHI
jgi:hypothetical protein